MFGIVIATHSDFAEGLRHSAEMIAGPQENLETVCFYNGESIEDLTARIVKIAGTFVEKKLHVIYVADMSGASPFNACLLSAAVYPGPVIAGACLPLILELVLTRDNAEEGNLINYANDVIKTVKDNLIVADINEMMG